MLLVVERHDDDLTAGYAQLPQFADKAVDVIEVLDGCQTHHCIVESIEGVRAHVTAEGGYSCYWRVAAEIDSVQQIPAILPA